MKGFLKASNYKRKRNIVIIIIVPFPIVSMHTFALNFRVDSLNYVIHKKL